MYIFGAILILDRILDKNLKKFFFFLLLSGFIE